MSCKDSREMWMKQKDEPIRVAQLWVSCGQVELKWWFSTTTVR